MALLTVERSLSLEGVLSSSGEESDEPLEDTYEVDSPTDSPGHRAPKLGRMRSPSFAGYFASKGGAVSLPDGNAARTASLPHGKSCGELQYHLKKMLELLREEDTLKMAVRIESQLPDKKRYLTAVANSNDERILVGIDWINGPTIGVVLELSKSTTTKLDGDGGFHVSYENEITHCFKPVSIQTLWSAIHIIERGIDNAKKNGQTESHTDLVKFYRSKINSDPTSISEWNMMDDLMSTRQFDMVLSDQEESEQALIKKLVRGKLKEVMLKVDLDEVTSRQIRNMCEDELGMDLYEFKSFLDTETFTILGQMDSASKIFDYLYLGSEWNASDFEQLQNLGIGYILNLTREIDNFFPDSFKYYNVRVYDEVDTELLQYWDRTYKFINQAKKAGSKVLVHCRRGISRSASSVIAYAMKSHGWSLKDSMEYVKKCRSIIEPNAGFQKQLIIYEGILNSSRNRYSALFRQRSKSERGPPSSRDRRLLFKKSKLDGEVDLNEQDEEKDGQAKIAKRPKSWTPDTKDIFNESENLGEFANKISSTIAEMPPLDENVEENESVDGQKLNKDDETIGDKIEEHDAMTAQKIGNDGEKEGKAHHRSRRRVLSRAKTLPTQLITHWEEMKETNGQKEGTTELETTQIQARELNEDEDDVIEQAVAASVMKRKLLRSLEQLQGLRQTKEILDNQFSVESIIRPSSLRKASFSRKLPFERTKSFSEEADSSGRHLLRERAFTVGPSKYFISMTDGVDEENNSTVGEESETQRSDAGFKEEQSRAKANEDDRSSDKLGNPKSKERNCDDYETSIKAAIHTCRDVTESLSANDNVIEVSQFKTVKESKQIIEEQEKLRAQRVRILRCPRRHTIGESKIWQEIQMEDSIVLPKRSKSSEGRPTTRNESPSPNVTESEGTNATDLLKDETSTSGKRRFHKRSPSEGIIQKHNSFSGGLGSDEGNAEKSKDELEDLSVKNLVKKHYDLIRNNSPPGNSESSNTFEFDATSIGECIVSTSPSRFDQTEAVSEPSESVVEDGKDVPKQGADIVEPGIVKRQSQIFAKRNNRSLDSTQISDDLIEEKEKYLEDMTEKKLERSKRNSVKERLRQLEGKQANTKERPVSLNVETRDKELDTEVAYFMQDDASSKSEKKEALLSPNPDENLTAKSAPTSPKPRTSSVPRTPRSYSMNDVAELHDVAKSSHDVYVNMSANETPNEDVKSLVDRFEVGALTPLE